MKITAFCLALGGCSLWPATVRESAKLEQVSETKSATATETDSKKTVRRVKKTYRPDGGVASETTTVVGVETERKSNSEATTLAALRSEIETERQYRNWFVTLGVIAGFAAAGLIAAVIRYRR